MGVGFVNIVPIESRAMRVPAMATWITTTRKMELLTKAGTRGMQFYGAVIRVLGF